MVKLEIEETEVSLILNALANLPFRQVAPLIQKLDSQMRDQSKGEVECGSSTE